MTIDWYKEFVDLDYTPASDDLICMFYFEPVCRDQEQGSGRKNCVGKAQPGRGPRSTPFLHG